MLDAENAAFIRSGVSISVASCGDDRLPNLVRCLGCKLLDGGRRIGLFLSRSLATALIADIEANRRVVSVFSLPSTNRTLQLKGVDAEILPFELADLPLIEKHIAAFFLEVEPEGVREPVVRTVLSYRSDDLVMLAFSPCAAFSQTPGPKAGQSLNGGT